MGADSNAMQSPEQETLAGYVLDIACVRKYPRAELLERARAHTLECSLMGHCIESGYALVDEADRLYLLDAPATRLVVETLQGCEQEKGIWLRATREMVGEEMESTRVELVDRGG